MAPLAVVARAPSGKAAGRRRRPDVRAALLSHCSPSGDIFLDKEAGRLPRAILTEWMSVAGRQTCVGVSCVLLVVLIAALSFTSPSSSSAAAASPGGKRPFEDLLSDVADLASASGGQGQAGVTKAPVEPVIPSETLKWWANDPPGIDGEHAQSIWAHELSPSLSASRSDFAHKHPQLIFIKGLKVGGTSVAVALDHVARAYGIRLQSTVNANAARSGTLPDNVHCEKRALWFHHVMKAGWMPRCVPEPRYVTVLREPISQTLSWETMSINRHYFIHYPTHKCPGNHVYPVAGATLQSMLNRVDHCEDTPFRQNVTMHMLGHVVKGWGKNFPGMAVAMTARWIAGKPYGELTAESLIKALDEQYFLVGVTEHLNAFLVLLAVHMGWDPSRLYYLRCKPQNVDVGSQRFGQEFPELHAKLEGSCATMTHVYQHAKAKFESHVAQLGPWFQAMVDEFEAGLKKYQADKAVGQSFKWRVHKYIDGEYEYC